MRAMRMVAPDSTLRTMVSCIGADDLSVYARPGDDAVTHLQFGRQLGLVLLAFALRADEQEIEADEHQYQETYQYPVAAGISSHYASPKVQLSEMNLAKIERG